MGKRSSMGLVGTIRQWMDADIRYLACAFSFIFSLWASTIGLINLDGILYIKMASLMMQGQWADLLPSYHLYFFPWLIMLVSKVSGLGLDASAHGLIACLSALLTYSFISILSLLTTNKRILLWGAVVIIFHPELVEAKSQVIRDHGFWAFYMLGLYYFLRFYQDPSWRDSILWSVWMGVAFLFRFEGVVLLCGLPLVLLVHPRWTIRRRAIRWLQANLLSGVIFSVLVVYIVWSGVGGLTEKFAQPLLYFTTLLEELSVGISAKADIVAGSVLSHFADEFALPLVLLAPVVIIGGKILGGFSPVYAVLLGVMRRVRQQVEWDGLGLVLLWTGLLHLMVYALFTYAMFFIQGRYVMPFVLLLLLLVPFIFENLYVKWQVCSGWSLKKCGLGLVAVLIMVNFLEGVVSTSDSKLYIKDAGYWLAENIDPKATLFSNNGKVAYYSGRFSDQKKGRFAVEDSWLADPPPYDYYAVWLKKKSQPGYEAMVKQFGPPLKEFTSEKKHKVLIYPAPLMATESAGQ